MFSTKRFPIVIHFLIVLVVSLINDSSVSADKTISKMTQQQFVIHSKETIKLPDTDILIFLKGIGSEHHADGTAVDNAQIVVSQHETNIGLYLEIIDGVPAITEVFGYTLKLKSCSAYHGVCNLTVYN